MFTLERKESAMLLAMEHSKENDVLEIPCLAPLSDEYVYEDDKLVHETKMIWISNINDAVLGRIELTEEDKETIRELNEICIRNGYQPLCDSFENL